MTENSNNIIVGDMASSVNSSLTNTASSDSPASESSGQSNQFENTSSAITSQLMTVTAIAAESASIGPIMLEVIDDDEEPPFRPFNYEPQPTGVTPIAAEPASIGAMTLEVIDDDEEPPFLPFDNEPTHPTLEETAAVMETTTLAGVDALPDALYINTSEKIEDGGAESVEEDFIVVPSTAMLEDGQGAQCQSTLKGLGQVLLVVDHRGNQGSDDPSHDPVNHNNDRSSDSTFRISAAALLTELEPEEVIPATKPEPWWKRNRPRLLILGVATVLVVTLAIILVSTLDMPIGELSAASYGVSNSITPSSEPSLPPLAQ